MNTNQNAVTMPLNFPVEFGNETITELVFRRPNGKDLRETLATGADIRNSFALIARLSGQTPAFVDRMDGVDIRAAGKIVSDFFETSPETGNSGSEP